MAAQLTESSRRLGRETGAEAARRPRVAFLTDIPTPYMSEVLDALAESVELTVLFCSRTGSRAMPWSQATPRRFRHRVVDGLTLRSGTPDGADYYLSPRILTGLLRSRAEAVISAGFSVPTAYAALFGRLRGAPLLIYSDGTSHYERKLRRHQLLARTVLLRATSACVAKSRPAAERFLELGVPPDRLFLAPHSSTMDRFWGIARERDYDRPRDTFTVLSAGRLAPHKGVDRLMRAIARAREEGRRIRLIVAGSGPQSEQLRGLAASLGLDVDFRGFVEHHEMSRLYAEADAFAFPTFDDPFGIVLLEAAASGLPLVASRHAGATWDLIRDGESGLIVDPAETAGFAAALRSLADDARLRRRLGTSAHRVTLRRSPRDAARGYLSAIEAALGDRELVAR